MTTKARRIWTAGAATAAVAAAIVVAVGSVRAVADRSTETWTMAAALALCAAMIGAISLFGGRGTARPRFALVPVLAGFLLLPLPLASAVGIVAVICARGAGISGPRTPGLRAMAGATVVLAALPLALPKISAGIGVDERVATLFVPGAGTSILFLAFLYAWLQIGACVIGLGLGRDPASVVPRTEGSFRTFELFNVPLAWMLAARIHAGAWGEVVAIAGVLTGVTFALARHAKTVETFRRTRADLESRVAEIATVHAIGREIISTLEPARLFEIIDRECRKILEVDLCLIALTEQENDSLKVTHRKVRGEAAQHVVPEPAGGLVAGVARTKAARRVSDVRAVGADEASLLQHPRARSAIAAPLIVEGRVTGVLSVESHRPDAYDDHQLAMLMTIAQQAAVAIENARHYHLATTDTLTGFHSRDYFFKRLEEEHRRVSRYGGRFGVLMLDVDEFKAINDRWGHLAGDQFLRALAETIRSKLRDADLPCRYGGDEFCVLLPETDLDGARAIAERIRDGVRSTRVEVDGQQLQTTVSIGLAAFPDHDSGVLNGLLRNADDALYRAKRAGRDRVVPYAA